MRGRVLVTLVRCIRLWRRIGPEAALGRCNAGKRLHQNESQENPPPRTAAKMRDRSGTSVRVPRGTHIAIRLPLWIAAHRKPSRAYNRRTR